MRTEVGLHMSFVSSLVIPGAAMTCLVLHPLRNCEYGLFKECLWFLEASNWVLEGSFRGGGVFTYLGEMFNSSPILLEVLGTGIAKETCRTGPFVHTEAFIFNLLSEVNVRFQWTWPVREVSALGTSSRENGVKGCY